MRPPMPPILRDVIELRGTETGEPLSQGPLNLARARADILHRLVVWETAATRAVIRTAYRAIGRREHRVEIAEHVAHLVRTEPDLPREMLARDGDLDAIACTYHVAGTAAAAAVYAAVLPRPSPEHVAALRSAGLWLDPWAVAPWPAELLAAWAAAWDAVHGRA